MKIAAVLDLETTGVDIHRDEIVQCAILKTTLPDLAPAESWECFARPNREIPAGATEVHGITNEQVEDCPHFSERSAELRSIGEDIDLLITFNGCAFDLPLIRRVTGLPFGGPHLDVFRVWQVARAERLISLHLPLDNNRPHAHRYTGALGSMWSWLTGREPSGEHDAGQDCRMTLDGARALVDHYGLDQCLAWTEGPLPGCVDWAGKIKLDDNGDAILTFGKRKGGRLVDIAQSDRSYLMWVMRADFHASTKKVIQRALDGGRVSG